MILFEDVLKGLVESLDPVVINDSMTRKVQFYWGTADDLPQYLQVFKEEHYPFIWSVSQRDASELDGYSRSAELVIGTRETRRELTNMQRIQDNYSFKHVLIPIWEALHKKIRLSCDMETDDTTIDWELIPNYSVSNAEYQQAEVWDVLKIYFEARFYK